MTAIALATVALLAAACSANASGSASPPNTASAAAAAGGSPTTAVATKPTTRAKPTKVTMPTVSPPVTGGTYGKPFNPLPAALAEQYGYQEHEYFIEGTATSYQPEGAWTDDGRWSVTTDTTAPYRTRIIVRLPKDPARFNGTVLVEWLNVSSGMDSDPDFGFGHDELLRQGYGYIAVSAQKVGLVGGGVVIPIPGYQVKPLKDWDPARYGSLDHPGDDFSYDIFSQAAATTMNPAGTRPFEGYDVRQLIAAGESQSAFRMTTYVNAVQPVTRLFDGFLVHSRGPGGANINATADASLTKRTAIRNDTTEPVLQLETETDLFGLGFHPSRQPDTDRVRTWEIAGTSHADQFTLDYGVVSGHEWDPTANVDFTSLCGLLNRGPQTYVVRAALSSLRAWAREGKLPPASPRIDVTDGKIVRDADGNATGGIRTAAVDAPIEQLSGEQAEATSVICSLFGFTKPFTSERLAVLYPTHADYVTKVKAATQQAVDKGFVLAVDQDEIVRTAERASVPQ